MYKTSITSGFAMCGKSLETLLSKKGHTPEEIKERNKKFVECAEQFKQNKNIFFSINVYFQISAI